MYFNSQPREGGWSIGLPMSLSIMFISTHSRAKAAGYSPPKTAIAYAYFNSQPREGGWRNRYFKRRLGYNFNSQPREGGWVVELLKSGGNDISTHSRAKAAGNTKATCKYWASAFQLTAARRRLVAQSVRRMVFHVHFNSQPREGG